MTLAKAKQVLKLYGKTDSATELGQAIHAIIRSWGSRVKKPGGGGRKGKGYERTVAAYLRPIYPEAGRGIQTRGGGKEAPDVEGTPLYVECKRHRTVSGILGLWYRAIEESDGRPAVVVAKEDGKPEVAVVPLELLLGLLRYVSVDVTDPSMQRVAEVGRRLMDGAAEEVA